MDNILKTPIADAPDFTWGEALYLPAWGVHVFPSKTALLGITAFAPKVQKVRRYLNRPMKIINWWRPEVYNQQIKGAKRSQHLSATAIDFVCYNINADTIRGWLEPKLEEFGLRMEKLPGSNWVHIDAGPVTHKRYFTP